MNLIEVCPQLFTNCSQLFSQLFSSKLIGDLISVAAGVKYLQPLDCVNGPRVPHVFTYLLEGIRQ